MKTRIYIDMDGTIANTYKVDNWLEKLDAHDVSPFVEAEPMITDKELREKYNEKDFTIIILTMLPKHSDEKYDKEVIKAKKAWAKKYFPSIKSYKFMPYGNDKTQADGRRAILLDDNDEICKNFKNGPAMKPCWCD